MAQREHIRPTDRKSERVNTPPVAGAAQKNGEKLKGELDDLLDEIDAVLEANAEQFVKDYVQKGGQ